MIYLMLLAHLLGDYVLQSTAIVRWKSRSAAGVLAHAGIITLTNLILVLIVAPSWWAYALLIGLSHAAIDLLRARYLRARDTAWELALYLLDQAAHLSIIFLITSFGPAPELSSLESPFRFLADQRILLYAIGYLLLINPAWVFLRFTVRGLWGADAAPTLEEGEKYGPMVERVLIATCVLTGQVCIAPFILFPRRLYSLWNQGEEVGIVFRMTSHRAETLLSIALAISVGLILRFVG